MRLVDVEPVLKELKEELKSLKDTTEVLTCEESVEIEIDELKSLPVINPESLRPKACWDMTGKYTFCDKKQSLAIRCTNCGCALHSKEYRKFVWNYCPVCGCKMGELK